MVLMSNALLYFRDFRPPCHSATDANVIVTDAEIETTAIDAERETTVIGTVKIETVTTEG